MKTIATILLTAFILVSCTKLDRPSPITVWEQPKGLILIAAKGYYVSGTQWNIDSSFNCAPSGLTDAQIKYCVDSAGFDFKPFNIKVTTDTNEYNAFNPLKRMRVVVTPTHAWFPQRNGGTAYIGSFTWGDNTPCFVFSSLLDFNVKRIAETISHEAGHTMGLYHQSEWVNGKRLKEYRDGVIMGNSQFTPNGVWTEGTNSQGFFQNDTSIINISINQRIRTGKPPGDHAPVVCH